MRVLIAEDDVTSRMLLTAALKKWGYEPVAVSDGKAAWLLLQQADAPHLVILDWMMPEMDGLEVVSRVRALDTVQPPYIIMLTTKDEKGDLALGLEAGANDYVKKPFNMDELLARVRVGQRMLELNQTLAEKEKIISLGDMAAGVAHEINSPLQVVTGSLERLLNEKQIKEDSSLLRCVQMAYRNSWRIAQITQGLLSYIQAMPMKLSLHNLNHIVENSLAEFNQQNQTQTIPQITISTALCPDLPQWYCDSGALQQIILQLLKNAVEAMQDGGEIVVKTDFRKPEKLIVLKVSDEGKMGIIAENLKRIFDPFFTTKPPGEGIGLGLSIVRGIVYAHDGQIVVDSTPAIGTTFTMIFPLERIKVTQNAEIDEKRMANMYQKGRYG